MDRTGVPAVSVSPVNVAPVRSSAMISFAYVCAMLTPVRCVVADVPYRRMALAFPIMADRAADALVADMNAAMVPVITIPAHTIAGG